MPVLPVSSSTRATANKRADVQLELRQHDARGADDGAGQRVHKADLAGFVKYAHNPVSVGKCAAHGYKAVGRPLCVALGKISAF